MNLFDLNLCEIFNRIEYFIFFYDLILCNFFLNENIVYILLELMNF